MSNETETRTQTHDSSFDSNDVSLKPESELKLRENKFSTKKITRRSVDKRFRQATVTILPQVEKLCALLVSGTELESAANNKTAKRPV